MSTRWRCLRSCSPAADTVVADRKPHVTIATPAQLALAWLLRRSPVMLPIPGTSSLAHLRENLAAATLKLSDEQFDALAASM